MTVGQEMLASEIAIGSQPGVYLKGVRRHESMGRPSIAKRIENVIKHNPWISNRLVRASGLLVIIVAILCIVLIKKSRRI